MPTEPINHFGKIYGRWTVLSFVRMSEKNHSAMWLCRCECGTKKVLASSSFSSGGSKSCGCLASEMSASRRFRHGMSRTSTHNIWRSMRNRCENLNNIGYARYGGRGIAVCERWKLFENFFADRGERPEGMSLERKDNNLGYEKDNCEWATRGEQSRNRRNNFFVCWDDNVMVLKDAASHFGMDYKLAHCRIKRGWSVSDALTKAA